MKKDKIIGAAKYAGEFVISYSVGIIVNNVIRATLPSNISLPVKVLTGVGSFVIGNMVGDAAVTYTNNKVKSIMKDFKEEKPVLVIVK